MAVRSALNLSSNLSGMSIAVLVAVGTLASGAANAQGTADYIARNPFATETHRPYIYVCETQDAVIFMDQSAREYAQELLYSGQLAEGRKLAGVSAQPPPPAAFMGCSEVPVGTHLHTKFVVGVPVVYGDDATGKSFHGVTNFYDLAPAGTPMSELTR